MPSLSVKRIHVPTDAFVPIVACAQGYYYVLVSLDSTELLLRTKIDDPETEWTLPPGAQETLLTPPYGRNAFSCGEILLYAKAVGTPSTALIKIS